MILKQVASPLNHGEFKQIDYPLILSIIWN